MIFESINASMQSLVMIIPLEPNQNYCGEPNQNYFGGFSSWFLVIIESITAPMQSISCYDLYFEPSQNYSVEKGDFQQGFW